MICPPIQNLESGGRSVSKPLSRPARALACALIAVVSAGPAGAYRFWSELWGDPGFPIAPLAEEAQRWDADAWGPGETLHWEVSRDEDWDVLFESVDGVLPYVERAMASWSEIPTADIAWTLDGVGGRYPDPIRESKPLADRVTMWSIDVS